MLYIEHTNGYIEHGYGYGLPSPLMTSNMKLVNQKFTSFTGVVPKSTGTDLYSSPRVSINLCISVFIPGSVDDYRPRGTLSSFLWNSASFSLLNFVHCGRLLETCTFIEFLPQVLGYVYAPKSK